MKDVLTVRCPDCGSELVVDAASGAVLEHKPVAPRARTVDLDRSHDLLRRQQEERDRRFQASVEAQKQRDDVLAKKFDQSLRRVRDNPDTSRPLRDFDLD
jgi:hypothetical protein